MAGSQAGYRQTWEVNCGRERNFLQISLLLPAVLATEKDNIDSTLAGFYTSVEQTMMQYMILL